LLLALVGAGAFAGLLLGVVAVSAAVAGQPFHVVYSFGLPTFPLLVLGVGGWFVTRHRYRQAEEQRMARRDAL
jgi:hypothetical protein